MNESVKSTKKLEKASNFKNEPIEVLINLVVASVLKIITFAVPKRVHSLIKALNPKQ